MIVLKEKYEPLNPRFYPPGNGIAKIDNSFVSPNKIIHFFRTIPFKDRKT